MSYRRHSPRGFKSKITATICIIISVIAIVALVLYGFRLIESHDFSDSIPEDAKLRVKFSSGGYLPEDPTPAPQVTPTPSMLPTPKPTPECTPLPPEMYSIQKMNLLMPENAISPGEAEIQYMNVLSGNDDQSVILGGWAYIYGLDAEKSKVYLVVSSKSGSLNRFYETVCQPGFAGVVHEGQGFNLDRADFRAAFSVTTYEEGPYKLGALVEQSGAGKKSQKIYGYYEFPSEYQFYVKGNKVVQVG